MTDEDDKLLDINGLSNVIALHREASEKLLKSRRPKARALASAAMISGTVKQASLKQMTIRQDVFCEALATGRTALDAYRIAFEAPTASDKTVGRKATAMLSRPEVRARVEYYRKAHQKAHERATLRGAKHITVALWSEAESKANSGNTRVRALELLGKDLGMFSDNKGLGEDSKATAAEVEAQIKELLTKFLGDNARVINGLDGGQPVRSAPEDVDG